MRRPSIIAALILVSGLTLTACATVPEPAAPNAGSSAMTDEMATDETSTDEPMDDMSDDEMGDEAMVSGAYLTLEEYEGQMESRAGTSVVYFFHADWCPSCRTTDESLTTAGVPDGLTVVKIDYDTATDLKREYGITQQHTFVQVDADGAALGKWTGSVTGEDIKAETTHG